MKMKQRLAGRLRVPGDKSISHRALIFSVLSRGRSTVLGLSPAGDCLSTINCLRALGIVIERQGEEGEQVYCIESAGLNKLKPPLSTLDAGNSGTTIRLMAGVAAGQAFETVFDGDESLRARPMARVLDPLLKMGAQVNFLHKSGCAPLSIKGGGLHGIGYQAPVASAQVQTALLLAGLQAHGQTVVGLPGPVRDHTLRLFRHLNVPYKLDDAGRCVVARLESPIPPYHVDVPADLSSAAFFLVAAALLPGSNLVLTGVGVNPGRTLVIDVLRRMGAEIAVVNECTVSGEPVADLHVSYNGRLKGVTIDGAELAAGIDEIPILAVAGALCSGRLCVRGASELRVKESDRISAIVSNLKAAGAKVEEAADGFDIEGQEELAGGSQWLTCGDHRLTMTGLIAGLVAIKEIIVDNRACAAVSYPGFEADLAAVLKPGY